MAKSVGCEKVSDMVLNLTGFNAAFHWKARGLMRGGEMDAREY
jgi:hypothetical protein